MAGPPLVVRQLLTTNLWILMIASLFAFAINGLIWASVFEYYFPTFGGGLVSFAGASLSLIVGSVYSTFLNKMMTDYLSGPTMYLKLLVHIGTVGDAIAGIYRGSAEDSPLRERMIEIKCALQHVAFYSFRIFAPENFHRLGREGSSPSIVYSPTQNFYLGDIADSQEVVYRVAKLPADLEELAERTWSGDPNEFWHEMRTYLYEKLQKVRSEDIELMNMAFHALRPVWTQLEIIESSSLVREPEIMHWHMQSLFVFYFFIWTPISSWAAIGWRATVWSYPFVAMAFLGIGIYNAWIGDAFAPDCPVMISNLRGARVHYALIKMERRFGIE